MQNANLTCAAILFASNVKRKRKNLRKMPMKIVRLSMGNEPVQKMHVGKNGITGKSHEELCEFLLLLGKDELR